MAIVAPAVTASHGNAPEASSSGGGTTTMASVHLDRLAVGEEPAQDQQLLSRRDGGAHAQANAPARLGADDLLQLAGEHGDALTLHLEPLRRGSGAQLRQLDAQVA